MLVLTRKANQQLLVGDSVKVTVLKIEGNRVKIGVSAPKDQPILRGELVTKERGKA